jgi:hypothetical protein
LKCDPMHSVGDATRRRLSPISNIDFFRACR